MATLTIKPTAAGNDVQIKSGDGNTTHATFGDTSTVNMSAGSIASAVTGTLGSGIAFPAGHVIGVWSNRRPNNTGVSVTNSGGIATNTDSLVTAPNSQFATGNRVFAEELSVTVDVSSTTSDLFVIGTIGVGQVYWSSKGSYGMVLNIPSPTANNAYDTDTYPFYPMKPGIGGDATSGYGVGKTQQTTIKGSDNLVKSGSYNIKIYVYAYNEASPSGSQSIRTHASELTVFEIKR